MTSTNQSAKRLIEEQLYEQVVIELSEGNKRQGLWAKAIADSEGNEGKAQSLYIKYRVQSIKDEVVLLEKAKETKEKNEASQRQQDIKIQRTLKREESANNFVSGIFRSIAFIACIPSFVFFLHGFSMLGSNLPQGLMETSIFGGISYILGHYAFTGQSAKL